MKKITIIALSLVMAAVLFTGCTKSLTGSVTMAGSTSMEKLAKSFAEAFEAKNDVTIDVQLGGSGAGYTQCSDGTVDIGNLSRALKSTEKSDTLIETIVAYDGIAMVVNPTNTVANLTKAQIADIFTGKITNWKEVGGTDGTIVVVGREAGSGTRDGFEEIVKVKDACVYNAELTETGAVKTTVASTPGAIGYISLGYVDTTVKAVTVDGVAATMATVKDATYAIQRPFLMIMKKDNTNEAAKAFMEFILSDEGQKIVTELKFVPVN